MITGPPFASVVIPAYNAERWLGATLESWSRQTVDYFEVIVVDDGSTDSTAAIAEEFRGRLELRVVRELHNGAPARPSNVGVRMARGQLIIQCDADDLATPDRLEMTHNAWDKAGRRDCLVFSDFGEIDAKGDTLCDRKLELYSTLMRADTEQIDDRIALIASATAFEVLLHGNFVRPCAAAIPKRVLDRIGGFNERLRNAQDYDLYLRIARAYPLIWIQRSLGMYRVAPGNISSRPIVDLAPGQLDVLNSVLKLPLTISQVKTVRGAIAAIYADLGYEYGERGALVQSLAAYCRALAQRPALAHFRNMLASIAKKALRR